MSDSLREQLLKAGFKETEPRRSSSRKPKRKSGKPPARTSADKSGKKPPTKGGTSPVAANSAAEQDEALIQAKKEQKAKIKTLIEAHQVKEHTGSESYAYQLGTRVRQLYVNEVCRKKLVAGELVITRLNGATYLIPPDIGKDILIINPEWLVITPDTDAPTASPDIDDDYKDYQVPDDLTW